MSYPAPAASRAVWMVWMRSDLPYEASPMHGSWMWSAHGPQGSQSGIEATPEAAVAKARSAAIVLDDASRWNREKAS